MYQEITLEEMKSFLKEDKGWGTVQNGGQEICFDFYVKNAVIRVYSSIPLIGISRARGKDAIRVAVIADVGGRWRGLKKFPRVTRQENWRKYLKERVMAAFEWAKSVRACPQCGGPLALREPKKDQKWKPFWACVSQVCNYTYSTP